MADMMSIRLPGGRQVRMTEAELQRYIRRYKVRLSTPAPQPSSREEVSEGIADNRRGKVVKWH